MFLFDGAYGQACLHTDLSKKFDYKISKTSKKDDDGIIRVHKVTIEIYSKADRKLFQKIEYIPDGIFDSTFSECENARSLITGKHKKTEVSDDDYGDIVVADLNFDGKEDLAVKNNIPADVGPEYLYFIQGKRGFIKDEYLSEKMSYFPWLIKPKKHELIALAHPFPGTHIYQFQYNTVTKKWRKVSDRHIYHDIGLEKVLSRLEK